MKVMLRTLGLFCTCCCLNLYSFAQSPVSEEKWGVVLEHPGMKKVKVKFDITYFKDEKNELKLDIYLPPNISPKDKLPVIIFLPETSKNKSMEIYKTWPRLVAAYGFIGVSLNVNAEGENYKKSVNKLIEFISTQGSIYQIDTNQVGIFSASHVPDDVIHMLVKENSISGLKAVTLYYRNPTLTGPFRTDLPVLWVTDDQTNFTLNRTTPIWNEVQKSKAPWTMTFGKGMPYFFDAFSDTDDARKLIRQTIYFFKNHLEPIPAHSWEHSNEREMFTALYRADYAKAAEACKLWLSSHPDDQNVNLKYAMLMFLLKNFAEAELAYQKVKDIPPVYKIDFAKTLLALGKVKEAEQCISEAMATGEVRSSPYAGIGSFLYSIGKHQEGIKYYEKAIQVNSRGIDFYNLACGYAKLNIPDKAFENLNKAIENGYNSKQQFEKDADLETLKNDNRWPQLLKKPEID